MSALVSLGILSGHTDTLKKIRSESADVLSEIELISIEISLSEKKSVVERVYENLAEIESSELAGINGILLRALDYSDLLAKVTESKAIRSSIETRPDGDSVLAIYEFNKGILPDNELQR